MKPQEAKVLYGKEEFLRFSIEGGVVRMDLRLVAEGFSLRGGAEKMGKLHYAFIVDKRKGL